MGSLLLLGVGGRGAPGVPADPSFASVVFLSGFEGADASTTLDDESLSNHTMTANGNAQLDTAQAAFGSSSGLFDGTGDFWTAPDHANWNLGQCTLEAWIRWPSGLANGTYNICDVYQGAGSRAWRLNFTKGTTTTSIGFQISTDGSTAAGAAAANGDLTFIPADTWVHIAADRDGSNVMRCYVGGAVGGTTATVSGTTFDTTSTMGIGRASSGQLAWNGWIDELRITNGVARYAGGSFTPPAAAFPRA